MSVSRYDNDEYNRHRSGDQVVCITWYPCDRVRVSDQIGAKVRKTLLFRSVGMLNEWVIGGEVPLKGRLSPNELTEHE